MKIGIGRRLRRAHMAFSRALRLSLAREGFSFSQFVHLERLWEEDGLTQAELSRRVGIEMASSTAVIAELEEMALIERSRNVKDRRQILVYLTGKGRQVEDRLLRRVAAVNTIARGRLTKAQTTELFTLLDQISDNLGGFEPEWTDDAH